MLLIDGPRLIVVALLPARDEVAAVVRSKVALIIPARATVKEFIAMIRAVASQRGRPRAVPVVRLTGRERQVIELIADGSSNREIAGSLTIAAHTVKTHVHNILEKLALRTRLQIAAYAHAEGFRTANGKGAGRFAP